MSQVVRPEAGWDDKKGQGGLSDRHTKDRVEEEEGSGPQEVEGENCCAHLGLEGSWRVSCWCVGFGDLGAL